MQNMFDDVLANAEGFRPAWESFLDEWREKGDDLPFYLLFPELAKYIAGLINSGKDEEIEAIFSIVERWHIEGDAYVRQAATIGLLEDLQNVNLVGSVIQDEVEKRLHPESRKWWFKVQQFWREGKIIKDD